MHTAENVYDYGPLHGFWTFLFERLNKVLKSFKTNNHNGGELETTFFREFHRTVQTSRVVSLGSLLLCAHLIIRQVTLAGSAKQPELLQTAVRLMHKASDDDRGTLQALARDLDAHQEDGPSTPAVGLMFLT